MEHTTTDIAMLQKMTIEMTMIKICHDISSIELTAGSDNDVETSDGVRIIVLVVDDVSIYYNYCKNCCMTYNCCCYFKL